jgi:hypothetical protein
VTTARRHTILDGVQNAEKRQQAPPLQRCKAQNKRGEPCSATIVGPGGYCTAHDPERKVDMRALGSKGGRGRKAIDPERVHPGLREYLKREVHPERVWTALEMAMEGQNESARVGASKVLMDALAEPARGCPECAAREMEAPDVEAKLIELLARHARHADRKAEIRAVVHEELAPLAEHVDVAQVEEQLSHASEGVALPTEMSLSEDSRRASGSLSGPMALSSDMSLVEASHD